MRLKIKGKATIEDINKAVAELERIMGECDFHNVNIYMTIKTKDGEPFVLMSGDQEVAGFQFDGKPVKRKSKPKPQNGNVATQGSNDEQD